jgi:pyruvate kinase
MTKGHMPKTKIICTLGPASSTETVLKEMVRAGMSIARLNFSHAQPKELDARLALIRKINKKCSKCVKLLGDLEGHRIRIGEFEGSRPIKLKKHDIVWVAQGDAIGSPGKISFDYSGSLDVIKNGHHIYIDDGNIALKVIGRKGKSLKTQVIVGGLLKERKGVNIPDAKLKFRGLSDNDKKNIRFCIKNNIEYIAQSFVRTKDDILRVKELLPNTTTRPRVIAKIESRDGIHNIDDIIKVSDGIMVARGDMGVAIPIYEVPVVQKLIIKKCNLAGKFVITATQMLESMTENRIPTRAEATDVANAIIDGTDYVMLSGESAVGKYPVETVRTMERIIKFTEAYLGGKADI